MSIEYLGLSSINGPLIVLEGVQDAFYDEIVEFVVDGTERKIGRIVEIYEDKAVIQVFEGSENMSLKNTHTKLTGHPMEIALSPDILGRTFNGIGQPIDDLGPLVSTLKRDVNGLPLNPVRREYPRNYIRTGISAKLSATCFPALCSPHLTADWMLLSSSIQIKLTAAYRNSGTQSTASTVTEADTDAFSLTQDMAIKSGRKSNPSSFLRISNMCL